MPSIVDVERIIAELPQVTEGSRWGNRTWLVGGKGFAWQRPLSKADVKCFAPAKPPEGALLAVRLTDLAEKDAVLATSSEAVFTIAHFNGYAAVLIQLEAVDEVELKDLIVTAWLACAPRAVAEAYMKQAG